jgi:hypothetical protein
MLIGGRIVSKLTKFISLSIIINYELTIFIIMQIIAGIKYKFKFKLRIVIIEVIPVN